MYQLRPPPIWYQFKATGLPRQKQDSKGDPIWVEHPEIPGSMCGFLDFKILPDKVLYLRELDGNESRLTM